MSTYGLVARNDDDKGDPIITSAKSSNFSIDFFLLFVLLIRLLTDGISNSELINAPSK